MLIWVFKTVPIVSEDQCLRIHEKFDYVFDGGEFDVVIKLMDMDTLFYINRGQEKGIDMAEINQKYKDRLVPIYYPEYWPPWTQNAKFATPQNGPLEIPFFSTSFLTNKLDLHLFSASSMFKGDVYIMKFKRKKVYFNRQIIFI